MTRLPRLAAAALVALLALGGAAPAGARPARTLDEQRESLFTLLSAYEMRVDRKVLDTIGPDVNDLLVDLADGPKVRPRVRVRAVSALGYYPSARTKAYLVSLIHERSLKGSAIGRDLRRQALRSYGFAYRDGAVDELLSVKDDPQPLVREAVAHGLGDTGSAYAITALETWLDQERDIVVRTAIDRSLDRLRGR
ncbi:MAG: HEAT repeat domain-containing protein [Myxococcales bacterium]|nr:HEAT repeat domain-containing protein [Myxococcales bacterium]MCB9734350.1 HEAT repeat domain-containing protein [Deltaproteobacteria bacterium]